MELPRIRKLTRKEDCSGKWGAQGLDPALPLTNHVMSIKSLALPSPPPFVSFLHIQVLPIFFFFWGFFFFFVFFFFFLESFPRHMEDPRLRVELKL